MHRRTVRHQLTTETHPTVLGDRNVLSNSVKTYFWRIVSVTFLGISITFFACSARAFMAEDTLRDQRVLRYATPNVPHDVPEKITYQLEKFPNSTPEYVTVDGSKDYVRSHKLLWEDCIAQFFWEAALTDDASMTWKDDHFPRHYHLPSAELARPYYDGWKIGQEQLFSALEHESEDELRSRMKADMRRVRITRASKFGLCSALAFVGAIWLHRRRCK